MVNIACPLCGSKLGNIVTNTKPFGGPPFVIRRLRQCASCLGRWATLEFKVCGGVPIHEVLEALSSVPHLHTDAAPAAGA